MSKEDDWYRSEGWSEEDRIVFEDKISRAKGNYHKSQYARIKALSLIETDDIPKIMAAVRLLHRTLDEWPSEFEFEIEETHAALGDAYRRLGDFKSAITNYEKAITWDVRSRSAAYWEYPEMIVTQNLTDYYGRALEIVDRQLGEEEFVMEFQNFIYHAVHAITSESKNDIAKAKQDAKAALTSVEVKKSLFSHHPEAGLVPRQKYKHLIERLEQIITQ